MGAKIDNLYKYAAFISYAHADEAVAKKLHVALETYPLPKGMDKAERDKLFPVFRDVTELTAHHSLSEKIRDAVKTSRFLIVLCSPASKKSHWVNEEIKLFRKLHGEGSILAVIVDGVPDTAFPPALTEDGREPLAANMATNEGFRFGVTQLAASMLGVGLDTLVQRDQKRRRLRTQLVTAVTTTLAVVMGALAWTAIDARDDAEVAQAKAEVSRDAAEEMVEFMIGDLKNDLTPIQKLDLFDGIGKRVADYYDAIPLEDMDDDRMMRRARSLHILGDVELNRGNYEEAEKILKEAYLISEDVYLRNPENTTAIFAHAQSEFWMGENFKKQNLIDQSETYWSQYEALARRLYKIEPTNFNWIMEAGWGANNSGFIAFKNGDFALSKTKYNEALNFFEKALSAKPESKLAQSEFGNVLAGLTLVEEEIGLPNSTIKWAERYSQIFEQLKEGEPQNYQWKYLYYQAEFRRQKLGTGLGCQDEYSLDLINKLKKLVKYDPKNQVWAKEYIIQWATDIVTCHRDGQYRSNDIKELTAFASNYNEDPTISNIVTKLSNMKPRQ